MLLKVNNLSVRVQKNERTILKKISLEIKNNSVYVLIGPNGSGKSSLAYTLMGLPTMQVTSGQILFRGKDITLWSTERRARAGITLAFQDPAYFEGIKVRDFLLISNRGKTNQNDLIRSLKLVGLEPAFLEREMDRTLSGGERKRIELASVILMKPKLIILDEPDSGLDIIIYRELINILQGIKENIGTSILLITHREELGLIADEAAFLFQGEILAQGEFRKVMRKYCQKVGRKKICPQHSKNF